MTGLVAGHLMDGVVNSVQTVLLGAGGQLKLAGSSTVLAVHTPSQILLGGGGHINSAGAQFDHTNMHEAVSALKETIDKMIEEGDI